MHFNPEQEARLHQTAERIGRNAEEIVNLAVERFLAEERRALDTLRAAIDEGDADIEAGRYTDYTDDTLHEFFEGVRRRGRETLARDDKPSG